MKKKRDFRLEGKDTHGVSSYYTFTGRVTATMEVLSPEPKNGPEWVVRLNAATPVGELSLIAEVAPPTNRKPMAEIQFAAFESLLSTSKGQEAAIAYAKYWWREQEHGEELTRIR